MKVCKQHLPFTVNKMLVEKIRNAEEPVLFVRRTQETCPCQEHVKDPRARVRGSKCSGYAVYEVI